MPQICSRAMVNMQDDNACCQYLIRAEVAAVPPVRKTAMPHTVSMCGIAVDPVRARGPGRARADQNAASSSSMMSLSVAAMMARLAVSSGSTFFAKKDAVATLPS